MKRGLILAAALAALARPSTSRAQVPSTAPAQSPFGGGIQFGTPPPAPPPIGSTSPVAGQPPSTSTTTVRRPTGPASLSGVVLTPTAYRGTGRQVLGLNLDFVGAYYIGRIYGKNDLQWTIDKKNYVDRIGQWFFMVDGKMQIQTEGPVRPAVASGVIGSYVFRDGAAAAVGSISGATTIKPAATQSLAGTYLVATKRVLRTVVLSGGIMDGDIASQPYLLSDFISSPQALLLSGHPGQTPHANSMLFGSLLWTSDPTSPFGIEFMKPTGAPLKPVLINVRLGHFRFATFELAYLGFQGGWDLLGNITFRYTQFPR